MGFSVVRDSWVRLGIRFSVVRDWLGVVRDEVFRG